MPHAVYRNWARVLPLKLVFDLFIIHLIKTFTFHARKNATYTIK